MARPQLHLIPLPVALEYVQAHMEDQDETADKIAVEVRALTTAVTALSTRLQVHDNRKAWMDGLTRVVLGGVLLAVLGMFYHLAIVVQSARLPGVAP